MLFGGFGGCYFIVLFLCLISKGECLLCFRIMVLQQQRTEIENLKPPTSLLPS